MNGKRKKRRRSKKRRKMLRIWLRFLMSNLHKLFRSRWKRLNNLQNYNNTKLKSKFILISSKAVSKNQKQSILIQSSKKSSWRLILRIVNSTVISIQLGKHTMFFYRCKDQLWTEFSTHSHYMSKSMKISQLQLWINLTI